MVAHECQEAVLPKLKSNKIHHKSQNWRVDLELLEIRIWSHLGHQLVWVLRDRRLVEVPDVMILADLEGWSGRWHRYDLTSQMRP